MTTKHSSTVVATSDVAERVARTISGGRARLTTEKLEHLRTVILKVQGLQERGLLNRQTYSAPTSADFERRFLTRR